MYFCLFNVFLICFYYWLILILVFLFCCFLCVHFVWWCLMIFLMEFLCFFSFFSMLFDWFSCFFLMFSWWFLWSLTVFGSYLDGILMVDPISKSQVLPGRPKSGEMGWSAKKPCRVTQSDGNWFLMVFGKLRRGLNRDLMNPHGLPSFGRTGICCKTVRILSALKLVELVNGW